MNDVGDKEARKALKEAVLALSSSKSWSKAKKEWVVISVIHNSVDKEKCICGAQIKDLYELQNKLTGKILTPVGSTCISKFGSSELNTSKKNVDRLVVSRSAILSAEKEGLVESQELEGVVVTFSKKLFYYLYTRGAFPTTVKNNFNPESDYLFLSSAIARGISNLSSDDYEYFKELYINCIKPYILGNPSPELWLEEINKNIQDFARANLLELEYSKSSSEIERLKSELELKESQISSLRAENESLKDFFSHTTDEMGSVIRGLRKEKDELLGSVHALETSLKESQNFSTHSYLGYEYDWGNLNNKTLSNSSYALLKKLIAAAKDNSVLKITYFSEPVIRYLLVSKLISINEFLFLSYLKSIKNYQEDSKLKELYYNFLTEFKTRF